MRFAVDACVPAQLADALRLLGADVILAAGRPAMPDAEILEGSVARDRVVITADKDFGELVFRDGKSALGVALIRFDITSAALAQETAQRVVNLENHGRGIFAVLDRVVTRIRRLT